MNRGNVQKLLDWLEAGAPERTFNMDVWIDDLGDKPNWCGTTCCMAGWCSQQVQTIEEYWSDLYRSASDVATEWLGLTDADAYRLFRAISSNGQLPLRNITAAQAAIVVRNLLETGEVNWDLVA